MSHGVFHLFVYGTLRSGAGAAPLMTDCERLGVGRIQGTLYDLGEFPALLLSGNDEVRGEIWRCPKYMLPTLDEYEGVTDGLFRRAAVRVGDHACWVYVAGPRLGPRLTPEARARAGEGDR